LQGIFPVNKMYQARDFRGIYAEIGVLKATRKRTSTAIGPLAIVIRDFVIEIAMRRTVEDLDRLDGALCLVMPCVTADTGYVALSFAVMIALANNNPVVDDLGIDLGREAIADAHGCFNACLGQRNESHQREGSEAKDLHGAEGSSLE
jgi:hypothetical protein